MIHIPRKLLITNIDYNGYCGRNLHPSSIDKGLIVRVNSIYINSDEVCFLCITDDNRELELMEHEVEDATNLDHGTFVVDL